MNKTRIIHYLQLLVKRYFAIIQIMSPELQQYYEDRLTMMSTKAWAQLVEDLKAMLEQYEDIRNCGKDNFEFRKGQVDILDYLIGLKGLSQTAYEDLLNEKDV